MIWNRLKPSRLPSAVFEVTTTCVTALLFFGIICPNVARGQNPVNANSTEATYVIVVPQLIRRNSTYDVNVVILRSTDGSDVRVTASLRSLYDDTDIIAANSVTVANGSMSTISLQVPVTLSASSYRIVVNGSGALNFTKSDVVGVKTKTLSILVQSDKSDYKPGQTVQFRVLTLKPNLKPFTGNINVTVSDGKRNVGQWLDQKTESGVFSGSVQLAEQASLGKWMISVKTSQGYDNTTKSFTVSECVKAAFVVKVQVPEYYVIRLTDRELQQPLRITVTASYDPRDPLASPINGRATVRVWAPHCCAGVTSGSKTWENVEVRNGTADVFLPIAEFPMLVSNNRGTADYWLWLGSGYSSYGPAFQVAANVTDSVTGLTLADAGGATFRCVNLKYKLEFLDVTPTVYRANLPFYIYLQLRHHNGSAPDASDVRSQSIDIKINSVPLKTVPIPPSGLVMTPVVVNDTRGVNVYLSAEYLDVTTNMSISAYTTLELFTSRSGQSIQVYLNNGDGVVQPDMPAVFTVNSSHPFSTVFYQLLSRGTIAKSGKVDFGSPSTVNQLSVAVDGELRTRLAPSSRIVVWIVTSDGEILSDSLDFTVNATFQNQVSAVFSSDAIRPSDLVNVSVVSKPRSFVGLLAVVRNFAESTTQSGNDVTADSVLQDLSTYDTRSALWTRYSASNVKARRRRRETCFGCAGGWKLPYVTGGKESAEVFELAGVIVLTDGYVHVPQYRSWYYWPRRSRSSGATSAVPPRMDPIIPKLPPMSVASLPDTSEIVPVDSEALQNSCPPTWLWTNVTTGADGTAVVESTAPDRNAIWSLSAFSISPEFGFGIMRNPAKLKVFNSFLVSLYAPRSLVRGEEFAVRIVVYNFADATAEVNITIRRSDLFKVRFSNTIEPKNTALSTVVQVSGGGTVVTYFWIVAQTLGEISVDVDAFSGIDVQFTHAVILVKPEGIPQVYSSSVYISVATGETFRHHFNVSLPGVGILVNGSECIEVTVTGDIMCKTIVGLGALIRLPTGCGEQTMINFAPNVYILIYLQVTGQLNATTSSKAIAYTIAGYQQELMYQRSDGSFSAFGSRDVSGSLWLTAFVLKCFHEARQYIGVTDSDLLPIIQWLLRNQLASGAFNEPGRVIHRELQGGSAKNVSLTAYVLIALLENSDNTLINLVAYRANAVDFLAAQLSSIRTDAYALSIVTYALTLAGSSSAVTSLGYLEALATNADGMRYWKTAGVASGGWQPWTPPYGAGRPFDVELNAYALLTYTVRRDLIAATSVAKWIMSQQNPRGGFSSTQDTVIGLQALSRFAALSRSSSSVSVTLAADSFSRQLVVDRDNSLVVQTVQIPNNATDVSVTATGSGIAIVQLTVKYNVLVDSSSRTKRAAVSPSTNDMQMNVTQTQLNATSISIKACAAWLGSTSSGMSIMEIGLPTGYEPTNGCDGLIQQNPEIIKMVECNVDDGVVVLYLDGLSADGVCVSVTVSQTAIVAYVKPASVMAYLYYEPERQNVIAYEPVISSSELSVCVQCPQCCLSQPVNYFNCTDGTWLDRDAVCNGTRECRDGDDERDCPNLSTPTTTTRPTAQTAGSAKTLASLIITLMASANAIIFVDGGYFK